VLKIDQDDVLSAPESDFCLGQFFFFWVFFGGGCFGSEEHAVFEKVRLFASLDCVRD